MRLVVGGAYQGKKQFACESFYMEETDFLDGATCDLEQVDQTKGIEQLQEGIKRLLLQEMDPLDWINRQIEENPEIIILCNEVGCGLVPIDPFDRKFRESVGRIQCELAKRATEVYRVYCGVGVKIK